MADGTSAKEQQHLGSSRQTVHRKFRRQSAKAVGRTLLKGNSVSSLNEGRLEDEPRCRSSTRCKEEESALDRESLPPDDGPGFIYNEWRGSMQRVDVRRFVELLRKHLQKTGFDEEHQDNTATNDDEYLAKQTEKLRALDQRLLCVVEVIVQEESYVDFLKFLLDIFLPTVQRSTVQSALRSYAVELSADVDKIHHFHQDLLLPSFYRSNDAWPNGPPFWGEIDGLTAVGPNYASYYRQYETFINLLSEDLKKNSSELATQVSCIDGTHREGALRGMTSMQSLLRPIQQLPRYRLHLKRFLDFPTSVRNEKYDLMSKYVELDQLINYCNGSIGAPFQETMRLQERVTRSCQRLFLNPRRKLVCHGWVRKLNSRDGEPSNRYLILFSDVLVVCSSSLDNSGSSTSSKLDVVHQVLSIGGSEKCYFERLNPVSFRVHFRPRNLDFEAENVDEWADAFFDCGAVFGLPPQPQRPGERAPVWEHDDHASVCFLCSRRFQPFYRRHHCRACGKVVCGMCSKGRMRLAYTDFRERLRVCDRCRSITEAEQAKGV